MVLLSTEQSIGEKTAQCHYHSFAKKQQKLTNTEINVELCWWSLWLFIKTIQLIDSGNHGVLLQICLSFKLICTCLRLWPWQGFSSGDCKQTGQRSKNWCSEKGCNNIFPNVEEVSLPWQHTWCMHCSLGTWEIFLGTTYSIGTETQCTWR